LTKQIKKSGLKAAFLVVILYDLSAAFLEDKNSTQTGGKPYV